MPALDVLDRSASGSDEIVAAISSALRTWQIDGCHMVVLHGSRVEGFANRDSDVDFWIVSPAGVSPAIVPVFLWVADYHLQPESIAYDTWVTLAAKINAIRSSSSDEVAALRLRDLDLYYRFSTGVSVTGHEGIAQLKRQFHTDHAAALFAARSGIAASAELEKAAIFAEAGDELTECVCLRGAVQFAVDSYLASHDEAYPNRKWRFEKLARACGRDSSLYKDAWTLKARSCTQNIDSYRRACRDFVASLDLPGWSSRVCPTRLQAATPFRIARRDYLLTPSTSVFELGEHGTFLWSLFDGHNTCREIIDSVARTTGASAEDSAESVYAYLNEMRSHGLIDLLPIYD